MSRGWRLGVIGGSGLYALDSLQGGRWTQVQSPWGAPSDACFEGELAGVEVVFLPRHGRGHRIGPSQINYRANIDALKRLGVTDVLSISACGSLREELAPGTFVLPDQFIDRTTARQSSFFGEGMVAHVSMAQPVCSRLASMAAAAARAVGAFVIEGGTYLAMEGPQFSTLAESRLYRQWGCDVLGMTNLPEVKLAREAELPYASIAMVTDYDCWREETEAVSVANVLGVLASNTARARAALAALLEMLGKTPRTASPIDTCLSSALITPPEHRDPVLVAKLDAVAGRVLGLAKPQ